MEDQKYEAIIEELRLALSKQNMLIEQYKEELQVSHNINSQLLKTASDLEFLTQAVIVSQDVIKLISKGENIEGIKPSGIVKDESSEAEKVIEPPKEAKVMNIMAYFKYNWIYNKDVYNQKGDLVVNKDGKSVGFKAIFTPDNFVKEVEKQENQDKLAKKKTEVERNKCLAKICYELVVKNKATGHSLAYDKLITIHERYKTQDRESKLNAKNEQI